MTHYPYILGEVVLLVICKKMRIFVSLVVVLALVCVGVAPVLAAEKIFICHATNSSTNPVVLISVSANAVGAQLAQGSTLAIVLEDGSYVCEEGGGGPDPV